MYRLLTATYAFPGETREHRLVKRIRERHVPITDVQPGLSDRLVAVVDRLLALRPDDRFGSATEVAEALEALIPPVGGAERGSTAKPWTKRPGTGASALPAEPEAPIDWSRIESALRATRHQAGDAPRLSDKNEPKPPSAKGLSAHRRVLEAEGSESGRDVHEKYRSELKQMKRAMAELRSADTQDEAPSAVATWLERFGEWVGELLSEPSAAQILIVVLAVLLVLALGMAVALG
jgi:hypothetical protein